jgi:hypothetical protein
LKLAGVPTIKAPGLIATFVTDNVAGAPTVTGPPGRHSSKADAEPTFRTHSWNEYVPAAGGIHVHVGEALQSWPSVHVDPSFTQNLYV